MKRNNIIKILLVSFITLILLSILGYTYAFFSLQIEGTGKDIVMSTGDLRLEYKDETELRLENAVPGDTISKVITVKNIGTKNVSYSLYWGNLINTIDNYELHVTLDCKSYTNYREETQTESGTCENIYRAVPISDTVTTGNIKGNISIDPNITHEYTVTLKFDNKNYNQNNNKNKTFIGQIGIKEYIAPEPIYCTFDGEMVQGAEYVNGQYTYRYMQEGYTSSSGLAWTNISKDGWGVQLTDKTSTEPVTSKLCTYINNKPVTSMSYMFYESAATTLDVSSFNTSKVTNMYGMFAGSAATTLDLSSFNTSNVTNMASMFSSSAATTLDLSNFNTSNVTDMSWMFRISAVTTLDLSSFDTSKVTDMMSMFSSSATTTLDLSSFDTSKVTNMYGMFYNSAAITLDLSSFNTSKVTNMSSMFSLSHATTIDLSNFDTSNVTNMSYMFYNSAATTLDLSSFNTIKVTDMNNMFCNSAAATLVLSSFNTSKVTNMYNMFSGSSVTILDLSSFNTSNVTDMRQMFYNSTNLKTIYASDMFNTNSATSSSDMFYNTTNLVGGSGTTYNSSYVDKTYARIDGGTSSPGYFTAK